MMLHSSSSRRAGSAPASALLYHHSRPSPRAARSSLVHDELRRVTADNRDNRPLTEAEAKALLLRAFEAMLQEVSR